jgi:hypothetical protein
LPELVDDALQRLVALEQADVVDDQRAGLVAAPQKDLERDDMLQSDVACVGDTDAGEVFAERGEPAHAEVHRIAPQWEHDPHARARRDSMRPLAAVAHAVGARVIVHTHAELHRLPHRVI